MSCRCPLLILAAEAERMAQAGIIPADDDYAAQQRITAVHIGVTRAEHGCAGPRENGDCRYFNYNNSIKFTIDPRVTLLRRTADDGQERHYL